MGKNTDTKNKINKIFAKSNEIIKNNIGDAIYGMVRDYAADIFDEAAKKARIDNDLILPILSHALGGAFYILRVPVKDQKEWLNLVSLSAQAYEDLDKEFKADAYKADNPIFTDLFKKKITNN